MITTEARDVWRKGLAPLLTLEQLERLRIALVTDDPRLEQGVTVLPRVIEEEDPAEATAACLIGYCALGELRRSASIEEWFANICYRIDVAMRELREPGRISHLLCWFDDTPRAEMRTDLLAEVSRALAERRAE